MKLAEIVALTFKYHRAVYISLTQKCPIRCEHCFVDSGPLRQHAASFAEIKTWLDGILTSPDLSVVFFSGGEPFSHPRALRYGLEATTQKGKYSVIATSAFWAKTPDIAERFLKLYPQPGSICISTDIYHEKFVPLSYVRNAAAVARARGIDVTIQLTRTPDAFEDFLQRFDREVGFDLVPPSEIFVAEYSAVGRASTECGAERREEVGPQPSAPCVWLGTPWVRENGVVCACPNTKVFETSRHPLRIGTLDQTSFQDLSSESRRDYFLQALRVFGPKGLTEQFPLTDWGWERPSESGESVCDLCHSITGTSGLPDRIRLHLAEQGRAARIDALRLAIYGEGG
jgi:hypothetical protein